MENRALPITRIEMALGRSSEDFADSTLALLNSRVLAYNSVTLIDATELGVGLPIHENGGERFAEESCCTIVHTRRSRVGYPIQGMASWGSATRRLKLENGGSLRSHHRH